MKIVKYLPLLSSIAFSTPMFATAYTLTPNTGAVNGPTESVVGVVGGTALWTALAQGPTGTGNFQPFLRVQQSGNASTYLGYNSNNITDDAKNPVNFTHDVPFSTLATTTVNNVNYFSFGLDTQQTNSGPNAGLLITRFDIGIGAPGQSVVGATTAPTFSHLAWSLGGAGTFLNTLQMTDVNSGNGQADVRILIPTSAFGAYTPNSNLILYVGASNANSSFEEFGILGTPSTTVPDGGSSLVLLGSALTALAAVGRRFGKRAIIA